MTLYICSRGMFSLINDMESFVFAIIKSFQRPAAVDRDDLADDVRA